MQGLLVVLSAIAYVTLLFAIASVGDHRIYPNLDAPATPERILMAVEKLRGRS